MIILALVMGVLPAVLPPTALAQRGEGRGDRGGRWGERGDRRDRDESDRGEEREAAKPAATTATATTPSSTSFGTTSNNQTEMIRKWASDTMTKNDKDGNKILEGDEISTLGQSSRDSDLNGDGKITTDELMQNSLKKAQASATATAAKPATTATTTNTASSTPAAPEERKLVNDGRKSYRFKSAKERGKTWRFAERDKNGDGQVSMSEYSRSWSDRTAREFMGYDTDGDGMITSDEVR
jgi:Rad3-related DNA helicase